MPRLRDRPEDFVVEELPLYEASGEGGHTFVWIEKRLRTTEEAARLLARAAGAAPRDVGYAGRKDRVAVARQWLSVPGLDPERALAIEDPHVRVLEAHRHPHKLRTGHLRGNRFDIVVRDVDARAAERAEEHLREIVERGFPNRFGDQRFGRGGSNLEQARELLSGRSRLRDRRAARFAISALQAAVFNEVLRQRPRPPAELEPGDIAVVHASGGLFLVEDLEREAARAARFEISATGPIFGTRVPQPGPVVAEREARVLAELGLPAEAELRPPRGVRLRGARRALRARPEGAELERIEGAVRLRFSLPPGSYATVLAEELLGPLDSVDPRARGARDDTRTRAHVS